MDRSLSEQDDERIVLGLLNSVDHDGSRSQRHIAAELGIALGLVNAYLKRFVKKGLVKVHTAPARRYAYYLTPQGFAEKSRLTVEYLSSSFSFFRQARADCSKELARAKLDGHQRILLLGLSDLVEIVAICSLESDVTIVGVVDANSDLKSCLGMKVFSSADQAGDFDVVIVTDVTNAQATTNTAIAQFGARRVLVPDLLSVKRSPELNA